MNIGILGLPLTGKTTLFNLLTSQHKQTDSFTSRKTKNVGVVKVADERVDYLSSIYQPKKTTHATIEVIDIPGISPDFSEKEKQDIFSQIQNIDAILMVVRVFDDSLIPGDSNPLHQIESLVYEILLRDLEVIENRINRLNTAKRKLTNQEELEKKVLEKCYQHLSNDQLLITQNLTEEELRTISGFSLFTLKPIIVAINLDESQLNKDEFPNQDKFNQFIQNHQMASIPICGKLEMEINELDQEERKLFLDDLGFNETGIERLSHVLYHHLGLISFFTVGKDEVRAWTIHKGTKAVKAAGKIHSDIERGFIRAEVVSFSVFKQLGTMQAVKEKGLLKVEGKETIIEDGDIINFRFNV
ncbi:MAG: redox-regulated ATPase YchF [Atribacterota bacterium]|nr:redox-regulated ATPase YchF [Atribacterota bacterium]